MLPLHQSRQTRDQPTQLWPDNSVTHSSFHSLCELNSIQSSESSLQIDKRTDLGHRGGAPGEVFIGDCCPSCSQSKFVL